MKHQAILHRVLLSPSLRKSLEAFMLETTGSPEYSSVHGHIHFVNNMENYSPVAVATPFNRCVLLKSDVVMMNDVIHKLRSEYRDVIDMSLSGCPTIDFEKFKTFWLESNCENTHGGFNTNDMTFAKQFTWHPSNPAMINALNGELNRLGFEDIGTAADQLIHMITKGAHPAPEPFVYDERYYASFESILGDMEAFKSVRCTEVSSDIVEQLDGRSMIKFKGGLFSVVRVGCGVYSEYNFTRGDNILEVE